MIVTSVSVTVNNYVSFVLNKGLHFLFIILAVIIGGMDMATQALMLGKKPHIIICKEKTTLTD